MHSTVQPTSSSLLFSDADLFRGLSLDLSKATNLKISEVSVGEVKHLVDHHNTPNCQIQKSPGYHHLPK